MPGTSQKYKGTTKEVVTTAPDIASDAHRPEVVCVDRSGVVISGGGGGGGPVTIIDGGDTAQGATTDNAISTSTTGATPATGIGLWRGTVNLLVSLITKLPSALVSNRLDVNLGAAPAVVTTTNTNLDVALSTRTKPADQQHAIVDSSALPTGASTETTLASVLAKIIAAPATEATLALIKAKTDNLDAATSTLLTISDFDTKAGGLTETAPATDTASSGHNGRLQRIAQNITTMIAATLKVQGTAAAGAAVAGNPVSVGGRDASGNNQFVGGNNTGLFVQGPVADAVASTANPVIIGGTNSSSGNAQTLRTAAANVDSISAVAPGIFTVGRNYRSNGTTWDMDRNNVDVTLLASAARTTLQNSANITVYNCKGIIVTVDVTATVSTVSLTPSINYIDPASGKTIPLLTGTTIAAAGTFTYFIDEAALASVPAPFTKTAQSALGRTITINIAVGNANSQTYSVGYTLIP